MTSRKRNMEAADKLVKKTLEAIKHLQPRVWFLENPATGHLKNRGLLDGVDFVVVDYCRFAPWGYRKPTQIWGSGVVGLNNVGCDPKTCPNMTLQPSMYPAGKSTRRQRIKMEGCVVPLREKYRIPQRLVEYLAGWSAPPTMEQLTAEVAVHVLTEPRERQQEFRPPRAPRQPKQRPFPNGSDPADPWTVVQRRRPQQEEPKPQPSTTQSATVVLQPRQLLTSAQLVRLCQAPGGAASADMQLLLDVVVETPDGKRRFLKALVDTGAQTNCIHMNALPGHYFAAAQSPIALSTVSGEPLQGGRREVAVKLHFCPEGPQGKTLRTGPWTVDAKMYDSATSVDIILGYPWLRSHCLGILPHRIAPWRRVPGAWCTSKGGRTH